MVSSNQLKGVDNLATTKKITMKQFNGTDYDTLYPKTQGSQITGAVPITSGGTGGTKAKTGMYNLLNGMSTITPATNDLFPFKDVSGSTSGLVTLANLITAMGNNGVITTSNLNSQVANLGYTKIQTGSYVGTGTHGANNPNSLTFDFVPFAIYIIGQTVNGAFSILYGFGQSDFTYVAYPAFTPTTYTEKYGFGRLQQGGGTGYGKMSEDMRTIYWYNTYGETYQLNESGVTYHYTAIQR